MAVSRERGRSVKKREPRQTIAVTARMKSADGWQDVAIRNVSTHGMRISVALPPKRGAYVELRRATQVIIGRAMWVEGNDFGVRTQDVVDIPSLVNPNATKAEAMLAEIRRDRRRLPRHEDNARKAHSIVQKLQYIACGAAIMAGAGYVATTVTNVLSNPLHAVSDALTGTPTR
ncbi:PilZ domain-containing protein [uncultured Sphingomonas sp.]|uniref:PilZ domain-containing protein n=1 Tax=uncultured Sphingomonas sp. TaxID=158754 RepID=UPI00345C17B5